MYSNVGSLDTKIRVILGLLIIALGFYFETWLFMAGWVLIATGLLNFCPLYKVFGIYTTKDRKNFWA
jgi:membrane-associated protease RseP (regulator of RpoE activity)